MGITFGKRDRLKELETDDPNLQYALSQMGERGYASKVDIDTVLEPIDRKIREVQRRLRDRAY